MCKSISSQGDSDSERPLPEGQGAAYSRSNAWLSVFGGFIALFCTFGQIIAFGTFQAWYAEHQLQGLHPGTISWIGSVQLWVFFFSGAPIGRAFDTYGPTMIMALGTLLLLFSTIMTSISTHFYQFVLWQGLLFGLSVGMMFYPCMAAVSTNFSGNRAAALGIVSTGSSVGGTVFPIVLERLFVQIGFGWTVRGVGLFCALGCLVAVATVRKRVTTERPPAPWIDFKTFSDPRFMLLALGSAFVALGLYIPPMYIVESSQEFAHIPVYVLAILNAGGILGRLVPAVLADAIGRFNVLVPSAFLSGLACLAIWLVAKSFATLLIFAGIFGFFSGAFVAVVTPCVVQISDVHVIGTRIGMLYTMISIPALVGGPVAGALVANNSYPYMIVFSGATVIAGSIFILWSKININSKILARV